MTLDTGFFSEPSTSFYCGMPDRNRVVTPKGLVTACVEVSKSTDPHAEMVIHGHIASKMIIDQKKQQALELLHYSNQLGGCISCNLRLICHGGCPMANIWQNGFPLTRSKFTCIVQHALLPEILYLLATNDKIASIIMENVEKTLF